MSNTLSFPAKGIPANTNADPKENVGIPRGALETLMEMAVRMREELLELADMALIIKNAARITLEQNRAAV